MRHTFRETWSGLRRNLSMTLSVIVTMWVSLALFGAGLMTTQQVDLIKGRWYDKIEISVFLCVDESTGGTCTTGQATTQPQKGAIRKALENHPQVQVPVYYESKAEAYADFKEAYSDSPVLETLSESQMQDSFRIKLRNPQEYQDVVTMVRAMPGVQAVQDLHTVLDPIFGWLNALKWATIGLSGLLLVAAALQISNTIRMAAFGRRRELGIMRLVGASNIYIMLPFLLESLVAGVIGTALACGTLAAGYWWVIVKNAQPSIQALRWITWHHAGLAMVGVVVVGLVLSILPTLFATKKYLRV